MMTGLTETLTKVLDSFKQVGNEDGDVEIRCSHEDCLANNQRVLFVYGSTTKQIVEYCWNHWHELHKKG